MSKADVIAALKQFAFDTSIQPDDVTVDDVVKSLGWSKVTARKWMKRLTEENEGYELLYIADGFGHKQLVVRKRD